MNKLHAQAEKIKIYRKQINELQKALELHKALADAFHFKYAYYQQMWADVTFNKDLPEKTKQQRIQELEKHYLEHGYRLVKDKSYKHE